MKVFLSWSSEPSKSVARALREWLPLVIQSLDPWMSQKDLGAGDRWSAEIQGNLAESRFGIICVAPNNQRAPWLNFEAGAISNSVTAAKVVPYIFEMEFADIEPGPLTQFQGKQATREGTWEVVHALNAALERPLDAQRLQDTFDLAWPRLEARLTEIPRLNQAEGQAEVESPQRTDSDKLDEVLVLLRNIAANPSERALRNLGLRRGIGNAKPILDVPTQAEFVRMLRDEGFSVIPIHTTEDNPSVYRVMLIDSGDLFRLKRRQIRKIALEVLPEEIEVDVVGPPSTDIAPPPRDAQTG